VNRRSALALIFAGIVASGVFLLVHRGNGPAHSPEPRPAAIDVRETLYASQAPRIQYREIPTTSQPNAAPVGRTESALPDKPPKAKPPPLLEGSLPIPRHLRSAPSVQASPELQAAYQSRTSRASMLNQRLERHLSALRTKSRSANARERETLERDIAILEKQLEARRPWESPDKPAR
jgi:hypothetical protein